MLSVEDAIVGRRSIRRFTDRPIDRATVERIIDIAARAPSGANMQPWRVHVVTGLARARLADAVRAAANAGERDPDYRYYPDTFFEPYRSRRRKIGFDLYALLNIGHDDEAARAAQSARNFDFFGAPVGLFVTVDRRLNHGSWLDCFLFVENVLLMARSEGLETCAQASWVPYAGVVRRVLAVDATELLLCGIALGYADPEAPENRLATERVPVASYTTWHDG